MSEKLIKIKYRDKDITLIPTAHVSKESAEFVARTIDEIQPDCICIELDQDRYNTMTDPKKYRETNITKIIKEKKVTFMLVNMILGNYQRKLAKDLGSNSGAEMKVGIDKSKELNIPLVLADRNIQTTFKRIWASMNGMDKIKMVSMIISSAFDDEEISEEDLANLQKEDILNSALKEVKEAYPNITSVLVDERDKYLCHKIRNAPGNNIVAILGAAHTVGMQKYFDEEYSIEELDKIPEKKAGSRYGKWILPVIIIALLAFSFTRDPSQGLKQLKSWVIFHSALSGLGVLIAGGHLLTILITMVISPLTALNPLLAAGWFAGLIEAHFDNPAVGDFDKVADDLNSFATMRKNKVIKILLIVILANIGSSLGTFISGLDIFTSFINRLFG